MRSECSEEFLYADGLTLVGQTLDTLKAKLGAWKGALLSKELRLNN